MILCFCVPVGRLEWCLPAPLDPRVWDGSLRQLLQWQPPPAEAGSQQGPKNTYLNVIVTFKYPSTKEFDQTQLRDQIMYSM